MLVYHPFKNNNTLSAGIFTEPTDKKYQIVLKESRTYNQSTLVLLICYMRGGSTFVSQIFNENPAGNFSAITSNYLSFDCSAIPIRNAILFINTSTILDATKSIFGDNC